MDGWMEGRMERWILDVGGWVVGCVVEGASVSVSSACGSSKEEKKDGCAGAGAKGAASAGARARMQGR